MKVAPSRLGLERSIQAQDMPNVDGVRGWLVVDLATGTRWASEGLPADAVGAADTLARLLRTDDVAQMLAALSGALHGDAAPSADELHAACGDWHVLAKLGGDGWHAVVALAAADTNLGLAWAGLRALDKRVSALVGD